MNTIITINYKDKKEALPAKSGESFLDILQRYSYPIPAPCGGLGKCGKCKIQIISGRYTGPDPDKDNMVLACRTYPISNCEIKLPTHDGIGLTAFTGTIIKSDNISGFGAALDVGTTTLALALVELDTGRIIRTASMLNPQHAFGADVISRINACRDKLTIKIQQQSVLNAVNTLLKKTSQGIHISHLTVAGNTTMLHLFCGEDPTGLGISPFTPVFTDIRHYSGQQLGLDVENVTILPSVSAYIGSDVTAGILSCNLEQKNALLLDLGTNGELALSSNGRLICASTAAGPAFEGAGIECGIGGVDGAINHIWLVNNELKYSTIGGTTAKGICGSGLIDLIALMIKTEAIDETGAMDYSNSLISDEGRLNITDRVYLTQNDVRAFQLAKSAICSGILTLLQNTTIPDEIMLAGALGFYINTENALACGILPPSLDMKLYAVGNSALLGGCMALYPSSLNKLVQLANRCEVIDLSANSYFSEQFIENMYF